MKDWLLDFYRDRIDAMAYALRIPAVADRIISKAEEPMHDDITRQEMNEFWAQEQQKAGAPIAPANELPGDVCGCGWRRDDSVHGYCKTDNCEWHMAQCGGRLFHHAFVSPQAVTKPTGSIAAAAPKPTLRQHDFSNPYLVRKVLGEKEILCVSCGLGAAALKCEPDANWRERAEEEIAVDTDHQARNRRLNRTSSKVQSYRNDVAGIGARLGGYLNVAPERGR